WAQVRKGAPQNDWAALSRRRGHGARAADGWVSRQLRHLALPREKTPAFREGGIAACFITLKIHKYPGNRNRLRTDNSQPAMRVPRPGPSSRNRKGCYGPDDQRIPWPVLRGVKSTTLRILPCTSHLVILRSCGFISTGSPRFGADNMIPPTSILED